MVNIESIIDVIDKEIEWCKDKDNQEVNNITEEQAIWFIQGLKQAKELIKKVDRVFGRNGRSI